MWKLVMKKATVYRSPDDKLEVNIYPILPKKDAVNGQAVPYFSEESSFIYRLFVPSHGIIPVIIHGRGRFMCLNQ